jgi:dTDP-4-amino-4,6-dideoxygalactose transaminase
MLGFNSRLDTLQAAVLLVKLSHLEKWTQQRRQVAAWYGEELGSCHELELPEVRDAVRHVYHLYVVRHPQRDALMAYLQSQGVLCGIHYPKPLHRAAPLLGCRTVPDGLPVCSQLAGAILSLPMFPEMTRGQVSRVAGGIKAFLSQPAAKTVA